MKYVEVLKRSSFQTQRFLCYSKVVKLLHQQQYLARLVSVVTTTKSVCHARQANVSICLESKVFVYGRRTNVSGTKLVRALNRHF